ncbi:hypothetical protein B0G52_11873 [Cohnella sp. SGD-V74]|uniref:hypothetical protein n=1 Tax=unclassified Cohnella TaxID=2636738 RepID=UPI000D4F1A22|nr:MULTISPECIES: hypothetical protein [unclassified Cohnella]PRX65122.1 hypothetical protein B0G52_11873 [Cohnella sp. SGD-V74]
MFYYLYLKVDPNEAMYCTLKGINYDGEVRTNMKITFDQSEIQEFTLEYPELLGMHDTYRVVDVYQCGGMGGIILE